MLQRPGREQKSQGGATGLVSGINPRGMQAHSLRARVLGEAAVPDDPGLNRRCVATGGEDRRTLDHMTTVRPRSGQPRDGRHDQIQFRRIRVLAGTGWLRGRHETSL
jgi:hypothetical protein